MRKLAVILTAAILLIPLLAIAQEDDLAQYASLDQLGNVINAFVAGGEIEGVIFDAADDAAGAIVRQFQITANLVGGPTRGKADIEFIPVGFSEGSATELENLEVYFDGTIGEFDGILPPLAPLSRVDDRIDVSALFEGWTAYGDSGPLEGPVELFPDVQTIWGVELSAPIEGTCPETRFVGRSWVSKGAGGAPDPLFSSEGLMNAYGGSHQALAGTGGRLVQLQCTSQGSVAWAQRMKDDGTVRPFGPTGVIALVKDQFVVFFIRVGQLDGRLDQVFYASPPDGGPVVVSEVRAQPLLLVPNPYEAYPTRISIVVGDPAEAERSDGSVRQLLYESTGSGVVRIQSPTAACTPVDGEIFVRDLRLAAKASGFARNTSLTGLGRAIDDALFEILIQHPSGYTESLTINTDDGSVDIETPACSGTGTALVNGEPMGSGAAADTESESTTQAGEQTTPEDETVPGVPWGPISLALALVAGVTAYGVYRNRTKKNCKPEEVAYDAALDAAEQASEARKRADAELQQATARGAPQSEIDQARSAADQAGAAAGLAHETMIRARSAYQDCRDTPDIPEIDSADGAESTSRSGGADQPQPEGGGTPSTPESPEFLQESDETEEPRECQPGETKWIEDPSLNREFTVLAGNVIMISRMASWNRLLGGSAGIDPEDFASIDDDGFEDALEDFDSQGKKVRIHPKIQVRTITVGCEREWRCENNAWVETGDTRRKANIEGPITSRSVGTQTDSTQKTEIISHVAAVKTALEELGRAREALDDFDCD